MLRAGNPGPGTTCTNYVSGQVSPDDVPLTPSAIPSSTLSVTQLEAVKAQAKANGTYFAAGTCPGSLTRNPVYVEGPCAVGAGANTAASPGFLVIVNGTFGMTGNSTLYGIIYAVNAQGSKGDVVTVGGNASIQGGIDVDGLGTVNAGDSHQGNLTYDGTAFGTILVAGGAQPTPNTFRQLPTSQQSLARAVGPKSSRPAG